MTKYRYKVLRGEIAQRAREIIRQGGRGRLSTLRYRIPHTLAHVQIIKHQQGSHVVETAIP